MNYLITEAVMLKANHEEEVARKEAEKEAERKKFKEESKAKLAKFQ